MSKVFSLSLATLMVFVSLFGSVQPQVSADVATPELAPMEESSVSMEVDQEEAVEEPAPELPSEPVAPTGVIEEDAPPAPADEPAEDANAPPAAEDQVDESTEVATEVTAGDPAEIATEAATEEAPAGTDVPTEAAEITPAEKNAASEIESSTEEPIKIVPNAVDPNPGDCPVDEICDGGGGDETPETSTVSFSGVAIIEGTDVPLTNLSVEVFDESAVPFGTQTTGDDGVAQFDLTVGETYTFNMRAEGYAPLTGLQVTVTENMETVTYVLEASPGSATITVIDSVTRAPIEFASVVFTDNPNGDYQSETDANGVMSFSNLTPGTYSFTVSEPGYATQVITVTVTSGQDTAITVELAQAGDEWMITVVNSVTGQPVPNADLWLHSANGEDQFAGGTNSNGVWLSPRIADGDFVITVHHDDYVIIQDMALTKTAGTPTQVEMQPYLEGTVTMTVTDITTGEPIRGAHISIVVFNDEYAVEHTQYGVTNDVGTWSSGTIPGGEHQYSVFAEGYELKRGAIEIVTGNLNLSLELPPSSVGQLLFTVIDAETREPIAGANVSVALRGGHYFIGSGTTDQNGYWSGPKAGWAEFQITVEKHGYISYDRFRFIQGSGASISIELGPGLEHDISFGVSTSVMPTLFLVQPVAGVNPGMMPGALIQLSGETVPLEGARIYLFDTWTNELLYQGVTGVYGTVIITGVYGGNYLMTINADGMQQHREVITVADGFSFELTMTPAEPDGSGDPEVPVDPEPGDGDGETPTDPEPGDGDGETPTDPEPGDGDGETPTNPEPGDGDDDQTPTNPEPGDGDDDQTPTNPVPGDDDDDQTSTDPEPGTDGGATTPTDPAPTTPVNPGQDDTPSDTGTGSDTPTNDGTADPDAVAQSGSESASASGTGTAGTENAAQAQSGSVTKLPSTGSGPAQSNGMLSTLFILAGAILLLATADRRRTR